MFITKKHFIYITCINQRSTLRQHYHVRDHTNGLRRLNINFATSWCTSYDRFQAISHIANVVVSATTARKSEMCCSSDAVAVRSSSACICRAVWVLLLATINESKSLPSVNRRSRTLLADFPTTTRPRSSTNCGCSTLISTPPIADEELSRLCC